MLDFVFHPHHLPFPFQHHPLNIKRKLSSKIYGVIIFVVIVCAITTAQSCILGSINVFILFARDFDLQLFNFMLYQLLL